MPTKKTIAITGTKGKTSTTDLIGFMLNRTDYDVGLSHSEGIFLNGVYQHANERFKTKTVRDENDLDFFVIEVTAGLVTLEHAKDIIPDIAIFTDFDPTEHKEHYPEWQTYLDQKKELFNQVSPDGVAIINSDTEPYSSLTVEDCPGRIVKVGTTDKADWKYKILSLNSKVIRFQVLHDAYVYDISINPVSKAAVFSYVAALAVAFELGFPITFAMETFSTYPKTEARFQQIDLGNNKHIVIEAAHSLESTRDFFESLKEAYPDHRIISVMAPAGTHDEKKRPLLGKIAGDYSEWVYVSRHIKGREDLGSVAFDMYKGVSGRNATIEIDREKAIEMAINNHSNQVIAIVGFGARKFTTDGKSDYDRLEKILGRKL